MGCACARPRGAIPEISYRMGTVLVSGKGEGLVEGYETLLMCEGKAYKSNHIYPDFLALEEHLQSACKDKPWIDCDVPKIKRVLTKDFKDEKSYNQAKFVTCEKFVQYILDNPCLMTEKVVEFFSIGEPHKGQIKKYQTELKKKYNLDQTKDSIAK